MKVHGTTQVAVAVHVAATAVVVVVVTQIHITSEVLDRTEEEIKEPEGE